MSTDKRSYIGKTIKITVPTGTATKVFDTEYMCRTITLLNHDGADTNGNTAVIFVGGSDLTTTNGFPLPPGYGKVLEAERGELSYDLSEVYCISNTGSQILSIICEIEG